MPRVPQKIRRPGQQIDERITKMNDDWIIVVAAMVILDRSSRKKRKKYVHSRYRKSFFNSLDSPERRVRQRKIPRCCLQNPSSSAWRKLYEAGNDQAMITLTGFDCASFASLLLLFAPVFTAYTPFVPSGTSCFEWEKHPSRGRKRKIKPEDCLGLVLAWTRTRGSLMSLQIIYNPNCFYKLSGVSSRQSDCRLRQYI